MLVIRLQLGIILNRQCACALRTAVRWRECYRNCHWPRADSFSITGATLHVINVDSGTHAQRTLFSAP